MRNLARLVIQLRIDTGNLDLFLFHYISPVYFHDVISATKKLCGFGYNEENERSSAIPSLALKIGHALKKGGKLKVGMALTSRCKSDVHDANEFMQLFDLHWSNSISSIALKSLGDTKYSKAVQLPLT